MDIFGKLWDGDEKWGDPPTSKDRGNKKNSVSSQPQKEAEIKALIFSTRFTPPKHSIENGEQNKQVTSLYM